MSAIDVGLSRLMIGTLVHAGLKIAFCVKVMVKVSLMMMVPINTRKRS